MRRTSGIGWLCGLGVGLGMGAALLAAPGIASADDMQISIDGIDLFPTAGNTATATSGMGDIAIAIGPNTSARAVDGTFDTAFVDGADSQAQVGGGDFDSGTVIGDDSGVISGFSGSLDNDIVFGNDSDSFAGLGNGDLAFVDNTSAANTGIIDDVADAGGNHTATGTAVLGNFDIASVVGATDSFAQAGSTDTTPGSFDLATVLLGDLVNAVATGGNFFSDIVP
jgi:hypothetical protein